MADAGRGALVMTTIAAPNAVIARAAADCAARAMPFYVMGDTKSPPDFAAGGVRYFSVEAQVATGLATAALCPTRHYARKNVGYLLAIRDGVDFVVETDDDNMPTEAFYEPLPVAGVYDTVTQPGWANVYRLFDDRLIWPRGLPLDAVSAPIPPVVPMTVRAPIQQGLADANPDVDAIYRLLLPLPFDFARRRRVALAAGAWCPFNSQNTIHFREAFALLYLPAHCSFRMTDIWRSFVAQRVGWANGWSVLFREATVTQDRNDHDLMRDFADEIPGYTGNAAIARRLAGLDLAVGVDAIPDAMRRCYAALVEDGHVGAAELPLLDAWLADLAVVSPA